MSVILYNASGNPEPSPEIKRRLRVLDPRLYREFLPDFSRHWAVKCLWKENDRRWEKVRNGSIGADSASDIVGWLPLDCSVDEAPAYLERSLGHFSVQHAERMLFDLERWNGSVAQGEHVNEALQELANVDYGANDSRVSGNRTRHVIP